MIDRFTSALYTPTDVAAFLRIPTGTVRGWAAASGAVPLVTTQAAKPRGVRIPFIGLAEAYTLRAIREAGVPMQRIRPALARLAADAELAHALASERLFTDGAELLLDLARAQPDAESAEAVRDLVVVRNGQRVLHEVIRSYLRKVVFDGGYAQVIPLLAYGAGNVVADPRVGFGQPVFASSGARLEDVIGLFAAGATVTTVADEFALTTAEVEQALRGRVVNAA